MTPQLNVGLIGVGNISPAYITGTRAFDILNLVACADLDPERAKAVAQAHQIPKAYSVDELLHDPAVDVVVNLTVPNAHAEVTLRALDAGKHVYTEKPLAISLEAGQRILDAASRAGLAVGSAPDTFMFAEHQTARKLLDEGAIGTPVAATGFMMSRGPEGWHPNPAFFYQPGGGPMLDMGPYYVTCLVNLLGPAKRVAGVAKPTFPERVAGSGMKIPVQVPTHYTGTIEFASGAVATLVISFDIVAHRLPQMEVYGSTGTLALPDPNGHEPKTLLLFAPGGPNGHTWEPQPIPYDTSWKRGIGLADMAYGILNNRPYRASGRLAYHVLEVMFAFEEAARTGCAVDLHSTVERPALLPLGLPPRQLA